MRYSRSASIQVFLFITLCIVTAHCNVIYRKYQRTVPPRSKAERKVTEIVEIFGTYQRPPMFGSTEEQINLFLRNDAPPMPVKPLKKPRTRPQPPREHELEIPPPSIYASRRDPLTTIRPNPYENHNGFMNHYPQNSVTITKYAPVPNFTIRELPTTAAPEEPETTTQMVQMEDMDVQEEVTPVYPQEDDFRQSDDDYYHRERDEEEEHQEEVTEAVEITEEPVTEEEITEAPEEVTDAPEVFTEAPTEMPEEEKEEEHETEAVPEETATEAPENYDDARQDYGEDEDYEDPEDATAREPLSEDLKQQEEEATEEPTTKSSFWWG